MCKDVGVKENTKASRPLYISCSSLRAWLCADVGTEGVQQSALSRDVWVYKARAEVGEFESRNLSTNYAKELRHRRT